LRLTAFGGKAVLILCVMILLRIPVKAGIFFIMEEKMKKKLILLLVVVMVLVVVVGCAKNNPSSTQSSEETDQTASEASIYPLTMVDSSNRTITIESEPETIVSAVPSNTEIVYALGMGEKLSGVSVYCNYPEEALSVEKIGDYNGPNFELIINLEPDIFLGAYIDEAAISQLENAGIKVILINPGNVSETYETILMIGDIIGASEEAKELVSNMQAKQNQIVDRVKGYASKTVFFEIWHDPLMSAGPGSFINEMIQLANGKNIADDAESAYPEYSLEKLISMNPQVYLTADDGFKTAEDIFAREGYEHIEAIKTGQLFLLNPDMISRPGPRMIEGFEMIARAIHPEAFSDK
jgi:iron complex transport system substrate-binding protein